MKKDPRFPDEPDHVPWWRQLFNWLCVVFPGCDACSEADDGLCDHHRPDHII